MGLEPTLADYIENMATLFDEARRVLREDGVMFLNMGDSYAGNGAGGVTLPGETSQRKDRANVTEQRTAGRVDGLKPKDLIGQPWRLAFALQEHGWWLRQDIIWHKPNPMPESVTDRPTKSHEYVFLMTKAPRYYYDDYAIREPNALATIERAKYPWQKMGDGRKNKMIRRDSGDTHQTNGRNKRSVWTIATAPFSEAHFATFPPKLIEPMILAGCPPKVCSVCGKAWERVVEKSGGTIGDGSWHDHKNDIGRGQRGGDNGHNKAADLYDSYRINATGFHPTCNHPDAPTEPGIVLDFFMGAGTVALVATQHGRRWMGCELNESYIEIAMRRLSAVQVNMFTSEGL